MRMKLLLITAILVLIKMTPGIAKSAEPSFNLFFSICSDASPSEAVAFSDELNQNLAVSQMSILLHCNDTPPLPSNNRMLVTALVEENGQLFVEVLLSNDADQAAVSKRRREIPWTNTKEGFMKATTSSNNVKTLALLLDNLVLDFVGIRLAPGGAAFGQTTNEEYAEPPATGRLLPGEGSKPVCSAHDCNDICEAREEKLLQIIDANDFNDEACVTIPQAQQEKDDLVGFVMGAGGGINIITPNAVAANFAVDVALEFKYVAAVARVGYELDSSFEVKGRPMSTKAGTLNLGSRFFLHKKRLLMGIDVVAVFRYYHISRADMPNANVYEFLDMGIGIHPVLAVDFTSVLGMFFSAGVEIYPRARQIVIEGGPSERIGFAVFSINSGFFMRF